jgi:hypothetical protein
VALSSNPYLRPAPPGWYNEPNVDNIKDVFWQVAPTIFTNAIQTSLSFPAPSPSLMLVAMSDRDTGRRLMYRNVVVPDCHTALNLR